MKLNIENLTTMRLALLYSQNKMSALTVALLCVDKAPTELRGQLNSMRARMRTLSNVSGELADLIEQKQST